MEQETKDVILKVVKERLDAYEDNHAEHVFKMSQSIGNKGGFLIIAMKYPDADLVRKELLKDADNSDVEAKFESL